MCVPIENLQRANGFGEASYQIVSSLQRLGHEVKLFDETAPVEFAFCQPEYWQWSNRDAYHIGYVPWESTRLPRNWKYLLRGCDELWTPSPVIASWFEAEGFPAKVYQHGVDSAVWTPRERSTSGPVKLLHIGEPAVRKGGPLLFDTFVQLYGNSRNQVTLTFKANGSTWIDDWEHLGNVDVITDEYTTEQMVDLVHDHDMLIYPSFGEGFGLIPLQAMSTGMPVIITEGWAPYEELVNSNLVVATRLGPSPWPKTHPGEMLHPSDIDLAWCIEDAVEGFDHYAQDAFNRAESVHKAYDWDKLTEEAFAPIVARFET